MAPPGRWRRRRGGRGAAPAPRHVEGGGRGRRRRQRGRWRLGGTEPDRRPGGRTGGSGHGRQQTLSGTRPSPRPPDESVSRETVDFAHFASVAAAQLLRGESEYGRARSGFGPTRQREAPLPEVLAPVLNVRDMCPAFADLHLEALEGAPGRPGPPRYDRFRRQRVAGPGLAISAPGTRCRWITCSPARARTASTGWRRPARGGSHLRHSQTGWPSAGPVPGGAPPRPRGGRRDAS